MKRLILSFLAVLVLAASAPAQEVPARPKPPETFLQKLSYGIGLSLGRSLGKDEVNIDLRWMVQGVRDGMDEEVQPLMTDAEYQKTMVTFQQQLQKQQQERAREQEAERQAQAPRNKAASEAFLAANAKKEGVMTTNSGLQYTVIKRGTGASPKPTDTVKVHYHGTLIDGTVFDSSVQRGTPAEFPVNRVIPGWTEALQLMKVGGKFRLFIPSKLAYGEQGAGEVIGPNSALIFDVELLDIVQ